MRDVQTLFPEAGSQSAHGILQGNGLHANESVEEVKANGFYVLHSGSDPFIIISQIQQSGARVQGSRHHAFPVLYSALYLVPCTLHLVPFINPKFEITSLCSMLYALCRISHLPSPNILAETPEKCNPYLVEDSGIRFSAGGGSGKKRSN
jgi:hypothetical protein